MYLSFYNLDKKPFQISVDPLFLWMGEKHKEALAMLKYGIIDNRGFLMLTGDVGTGKTTLINALISDLGPTVCIANITNPVLEKLDFFNYISEAFGIGVEISSKGEFLFCFRNFLEQCYIDGKQVLLIIDEAQRLSQEMLEEIRLLSNIERKGAKLLNIFFVGQDELNDILDRYENRAVRQRMTLQYQLEPLTEEEASNFIEHRLKVAGTEKRIFSKDAVQEVFSFSMGYPRLINIICDHAMLAGFAANKKIIEPKIIRECAEDLKLSKSPQITTTTENEQPLKPADTSKIKLFYSENHLLNLSTYIAAILFLFLLASFLYFPIKSGASFSGILGYWKDQMHGQKFASSKQVSESSAPVQTLQTTQTAESTSEEAGALEVEEALEDAETSEEDTTDIADRLSNIPPDPSMIPESELRYTLAFDFNSNDLSPEGYERLNKTSALMSKIPDITLTVEGHTDAAGSMSYNIILSKFRADIAKNYLVSKGVNPERVTSIGKGAAEPIASNDDPDGRSANRRVEVMMSF